MKTIDSGLRALPATAQVAKQGGEYLAQLFASGSVSSKPLTKDVKGFEYYHKGSLAYVGSGAMNTSTNSVLKSYY